MNNFTLANFILPVRKNILSTLIAVMGLMFHLSSSAATSVDLEVTKMVNKTSPGEGDTVIFTVQVENLGPAKATNVVIKDVLPAGLTFISSSATKSTYSSTTGAWGSNGALDLNSGQGEKLTIKARVNAGTLGFSIMNTAYVESRVEVDLVSENDTSSVKINIVGPGFSCHCNLLYPDTSNLPRSAVTFNESEVLRAFDPSELTCDTTAGAIRVWYNDEHALTLGVHRVIVKSSTGTTTTDYPITPTPTAGPICVNNPLVGTTIQTGDQTGNDVSAGGGRPLWPAIFITDLTVNGASSRIGDWQQGGTGYPPTEVCGTWKGAIRTVDNTRSPALVTVTPDADPVKNDWNGIPNTPPGGFASLTNQGYGAEVSWSTSALGLIKGHIYRLQFVVHDGDQNKTGGDAGQGCAIIHFPDICPNVTAKASPDSICKGSSSTLSFTNNTTTTPTVVGWFLDNTSALGCQPEGLSLGSGTTLSVSPTTTTTYVVIVTNNSRDCYDTSCVTVTVNPKPVLTLLSGPICATNQLTYSITLSISSGTGPFTASATVGTATVTGNTVTISGIPSGSGTSVIVTDAKGCQSLPYIQQPHSCGCPVVASISCDVPITLCEGSSAQLLATVVGGVPPYIYKWTPNLGTGAGPFTVSPTVTTTYHLIVTDDNGNGCSDTTELTLTVNPRPKLTLSGGPDCDSTQSSYSITLLISSGKAPYSATATVGTAIVTGSSVTISGIPSGSGTSVTVTDSNSCASVPYIQAPHTCCPNVTAKASPSVICEGDSSTLSFTGTPNVIVIGWFKASLSGCFPFGANLGTGNTLKVSPATTTSYVVIVTNSNRSCNDTSNCVTLTVNARPTLTLSSGPICDNTQTSYSISLAIGLGTGPFTATATNGTATVVGRTVTISGIPSGSGTIVKVTDANGCISDPYNQAPHTCCPDVTASASPSVICEGGSSTLSFIGTPNVIVLGWFKATTAGGCVPTGPNLGTGNTLVVSPAVTTSYVVIVTNTNRSCNDTSNCVTLTVNPRPTLTLTGEPVCDVTQSSYTITLSIGLGTGPFTATATNGTATVVGRTVTVSGIPSGSGTIVKVTDANGCISDPYNQAPHTCCPDVTATASPFVICQGSSSILSFTGTPGVTVVGWFLAAPSGGRCIPAGANLGTGNTLTVTPGATTTYVVIVSNANHSCNDTSNCVTVTVYPSYNNIIVDSTICEGSSVVLGGNAYTLSGNYTINLHTTLGCDSIIKLNLTVNPKKHTDVRSVICFGEQIVVGGQIFTTSVTDSIIILHTSKGCDSIITLNLQVLKQDTITTNRTICQGQVVQIGDSTYSRAGTYYIPFTNAQCKGMVKLILVVNDSTYSSIARSICAGGVTVVGGQVFNTAGTYRIVIPNSKGCDSTITLTLTVNPKKSTIIDTAICRGESITVGTQVFSTTGTYNVALISSAGCDSNVTLNLIVLSNGDTTFVPQSICEGDSATVGGQVFKIAGTYYINSPNGRCTNVIALILTVRPKSTKIIEKAICKGDAVVVGGQTFTTTGTYFIHLRNSVGCDSLITLYLDVSQGGVKSQLDTSICFGTSVSYAGQTFSTTGSYQIIFPSGICRDTLLLNLIVNPKIEVTIERTICEGNSVVLGGNAFTLTGNYTVVLTSAKGCDSTVHLNLTVNPVKRTDVRSVICFGEHITVGGQVFSTSVTDSIIILQTSKGCDSIITLNLQVLKQDTINTSRTICQGDFVQIGDSIYSQAGVYLIPFANNQCTGLVRLTLTVNPPTSSTLVQSICEGGIAVVGGHIFNTTGVYPVTIRNSQGCDSIITLYLTVNPKKTTTIDTAICRGETITVGTQVFSNTGTYQVALSSSAGCDSTVTLNLIVLTSGDTTAVQQTICKGDTAKVGGLSFTVAGTYYIPSLNGRCTNIIALTLTVKPVSDTTIFKQICQGQAVVIGSQTFTTAGTHVVTLQNSVGCDSIVTLILDVSQGGVKSSLDTTICFGSSVTYAGQTFSTTGSYQIIFPSGACRDTLLLNLVVNPKIEVTIERTICEGSSVTLGGNAFTLTGNYDVVIDNPNGCDSTIHLHLIVNPVKHTNIDAVLCAGEQVIVGSQVFTTSVTDSIVILRTTEGCDSIITVNLSFLKQDTIVTNRTICSEDFVNIGGHLFDQPGTYYIPFANGQCTGIVKLNLTVNQSTASSLVRTICDGDYTVVAGHIFNTAGFYTVVVPNALGCDSVIIVKVIVLPKAHTTIDTIVCQGQGVTVGGQFYASTGNYTITLASALGCDSVISLNLTVLTAGDTTVLQQSICANDSIVVNGLVFKTAGTYYVASLNGRCNAIIKLVLSVKQPSSSTIFKQLCEGQAIVIGAQTFNTTGVYTVTLQNSVGCDSIVTLNLDVAQGGTKSQLDTTICFGSSITFAGQTFSTTGTYQIIYPVNICRDTLLLNLVVNSKIETTIERTICEGNSIAIGGYIFTLGGDYNVVLNSASGCDSTVHLHLTVNPVKHTNVDAVLCQGEQVVIGGVAYNTSVTNKIIVLQTTEGCDSIITLNLTILKTDTVVTNRTICAGGFVDIGGHIFNTAGTHYITFTNGQCTGIVQLNLTVNQPSRDTSIDRTICEGGIVVVGGHIFSTDGKYTIVIPNSLGCDSTIILNLTVTPKAHTTIDTLICTGQNVTVGGHLFAVSGTYTVTLASSAGCDSIITLNLGILNANDTTHLTQSICSGDSITVGGQTFKTAGTYYIPVLNGRCNSIIALDLGVRATSATTINKSICEGQAVVVGAQTFTSAGTYTVTLQNSVGCDSIVTLILDVSQGGVKSRLDTTICFGHSVTFAGQTFSTTGTYQIIYPVNVCRDTLLLFLTVEPKIVLTIDSTICEGSSVVFGSNDFSLTGNYTVQIHSLTGCDSTINLHLVVNPVRRVNIDAVLCQGEQVVIGGQTFNTSVTNHIITLQSAQGCDSIITLNLVVLNEDTIVTNRSICAGGIVDIGGNKFDTAGTYFIPFVNGQCRGIVQLNLTVNQPTTAALDRTICEGDITVVGGHVFNSTGKYTVVIPNAQGCDSIISLNLIVNPKGNTTVDTTICKGQSITVGPNTFTTTGTYHVTLSTSAGCDSNVTLNLIVLNNGDTTALNQAICAGDSITVGGQVFSTAGTYYIATTNGICNGTIALKLTVRAASAPTILNEAICQGGAVVVGGQTFTIAGTYTIRLQNSAGCDSIVTLILDVSQGGIKSRLDTAFCKGDTLHFAGQSFSTTGTYQIIYPANVCRDTLLLFLTVNICDTSPITKIIIDSIPVRTDTTHCASSIPLTYTLIADTSDISLLKITACDSISTSGSTPYGTWEISGGCFTYHAGSIKTPVTDTSRYYDTLCVIACDTATGVCGHTDIYIIVYGYPPVAVNDTVKTDPNTPITIPVLVNDTTYDNDPLALCTTGVIIPPVHGTATQNPDGTITYTPVTGYTGIDSFQYEICDPPFPQGEGSDTAWVFITIQGCEIPNAFSPNGDGINDVFVIPCAVGDIEFSVYNRWGIEVYRNDKYLNDWDGKYKGSQLPDGTYYYVLKYKTYQGAEINKAGFITLHR